MLVESYPNPNKPVLPKSKYPYPVATSPGVPNYHPSFYDHQAKKRNITVEEYHRRDAIVKAQYASVFYRKGDEVYPHSEAEFKKRGKCIIDGMYYAYSQFEDDDVWPKSDLPYIINAHQVNNSSETILATAGFFTFIDPTEKEASPI